MLAARLARAEGRVHPMDWVDVHESHTPYEWMLQVCLAAVDPWGDERSDLRAAFNTIHLMQFEPGKEGEVQAVFEKLRSYVTTDGENDLYDEDALAAVRDQWPT